MAGYFSRNTWILAAILVAGLPSVTPIDYNTCTGGTGADTCQVQYSSHCCKSGFYQSATCCRNSCSYPGFFWSSTKTCYDITDSMCCSTKSLASESCCNFASYSRTSFSSAMGHYLKSTYKTCTGGFLSTEYCTNSLSTECCSDGYYASATCCRPSTCANSNWFPETCSRTSTYCCASSSSCCDYSAYQFEKNQIGNSVGAIIGGVIGGLFLLIIIIVVPVSVVCCCSNGTPGTVHSTNATVVAVTASSNQVQPNQGYQQPAAGYYQPPPYGYSQPLPPSYNQQWAQHVQAPAPQPQPESGPTPVEQPQPGPTPVEQPSLPQQ